MSETERRKYDREFYQNEQDSSLQSARIIAPLVYQHVEPESVVDVGCGVGGWLLAFSDLGATRVHGYDGEWVNPDMLKIPRECFTAHDIGQPVPDEQTFDLAVNLEAAEHLPPESSDVLIDSLARLSKVILFSAAIPNQEGRNHVNEQWPDYWVSRFAKRDYRALDFIRPQVWDNPDVRWWYKQNAMLFAHDDAFETNESLRQLVDDCPPEPLALVHPELFQEKWRKYVNARNKSERDPATVGSGLRELRRGLRNGLRRLRGKEPR